MIRCERVRFSYPADEEILRLDAFELPDEGQVLVVGPSGCGKTTFLHLVAGLLLPTAGRVSVAGQDLAALSSPARDRFRGRNIGIVMQQFHLLPTLSALQNLLVAQHVAGLLTDRAAAQSMLEELDVGERPHALPHALSVGQQQRVAIARALVNRPRLLLADEPTSNLDDEACAQVIGLLLRASAQHGAALVVATHDSRLRARISRELVLPRRVREAMA